MRRWRSDITIEHAAEIGNATERRLRLRRSGGEQREQGGEQQYCDPLTTYSHTNCAAKSHTPRSISGQFAAERDRGSPGIWTGFRRSRRRRDILPVRPVTLRRHLSMALPSYQNRFEVRLIRSLPISW